MIRRCLVIFTLFFPVLATAHFILIEPSVPYIEEVAERNITIDLRFLHPFEDISMDLAQPRQLAVMHRGIVTDLMGDLRTIRRGDSRSYRSDFTLKTPGDYIFYVDPQPYWEPAEKKFIRHQTKLVINHLGLERGWDQVLSMRAEIVPLTRPYGFWAGNLFTGRVLHNGKPAANARVEVGYYNRHGKFSAPSESHKLQVVKTDKDGVFSFAMPRAGWWGFAALLEDEQTEVGPDGKSYPVELGALIWVYVDSIQ